MLLVETRLAPSSIHGIGIFADRFIPEGTTVWAFVSGFDLVVDPDELSRLSEPARRQFRKYSYLDPHLRKYVLCFDDARFMNHADEPNLLDTPTSAEGMGVTVAARDIEAGEELTCDYSTFDAEWGSYSLGEGNGDEDRESAVRG
ncbi:MAG: SET domain-containing protein [Gemmatimonadota bacterium]